MYSSFTQRDSRAIHDCDIIICDSIVIWELKLHLKFCSTIFQRLQLCRRIFGSYKEKPSLLRQSPRVFGCARRICGSYKQNQVYFDNLRASSVVIGGFLDNVNKTNKKKRTTVELLLLSCCVNKPVTTDTGSSQLPFSNRGLR